MDAAPVSTFRFRQGRRPATLVVLAVDLVLAVVQGRSGNVFPRGTRTLPDEGAPDLREMRRLGNAYFAAGKYVASIRVYESGLQEATRRGNLRSALRFLNNLGSAQYRVFRYRDAINAYLKARDLALAVGDRPTLGALYVNLSSLYLQMGNLEAALDYSRQALQVPDAAVSKYKPQLLIQSAQIKAREAKLEQSADLLRAAVDAAQNRLDMAVEAQAWNELGDVLLELGRLRASEHALLEAFRLRLWTGRDRLYFVYESLGRLRELQGDTRGAMGFFDKAVESARAAGPSAVWDIYYERGKLKRKQGKTQEAFRDFAAGLDGVRRMRADVPPADAFRITAEADLDTLYSAFVETGIHLYRRTRNQRLAAQVFTAAEEHRSATLQSLWTDSGGNQASSNEYQAALAGLHRTESDFVNGGSSAVASMLRNSRVKVAEVELRTRETLPRPPYDSENEATDLLARARHSLRPNEVYLGFHLGDQESWLWAVTSKEFEFCKLPPKKELSDRTNAFVKALRNGSPAFLALGHGLYSALFDGVPHRLLDKPVWILAPDGPLFELPFGALPETDEKGTKAPLYAIQSHAIKVVTGIPSSADFGSADLNGTAVGLGDPIYNGADPRLRPSGSRRFMATRLSFTRGLELARLAGSSRELDDYANIWRAGGYQPILLEGQSATRKNFLDALRSHPAVVHLAAHVVSSPDQSGAALIALTLRPSGGIDVLSPAEISEWRLKLGLVVVNGCSSGHAATVPGSGLMGMTRAWLAAGARAVILTHWPIDDQTGGQLLQAFYQRLMNAHLISHTSFGELLRQSQLAELRAGGERANPVNWAAYFSIERN